MDLFNCMLCHPVPGSLEWFTERTHVPGGLNFTADAQRRLTDHSRANRNVTDDNSEIYAHLDPSTSRVGTHVEAGQVI